MAWRTIPTHTRTGWESCRSTWDSCPFSSASCALSTTSATRTALAWTRCPLRWEPCFSAFLPPYERESLYYQHLTWGVKWLRYLTWTRKVSGSIPGVATIRSAQLLGPWARPLTPTLLQGVCLLLSLINCKSLWIKVSAKLHVSECSSASHQQGPNKIHPSRPFGFLLACNMWLIAGLVVCPSLRHHGLLTDSWSC